MPGRTILWVSAHPSPRSLNRTLRDMGIARLCSRGHTVIESDLYSMGWNPVLDGEALGEAPDEFHPTRSIRTAYIEHRVPADVRREKAKILTADAVILQFPLWWYGVPAILKGWFDRVLHAGFAFGTDPATGRRLRFENGPFRGKRAMVVTTLGDRPRAIGPRGKSGQLDELLFGLLHGTLAYTGFDVLEPIALPSADRMTAGDVADATVRIGRRLDALFVDAPVSYRPQFTGEYTEDWELEPNILPGQTGLSIHRADGPTASDGSQER